MDNPVKVSVLMPSLNVAAYIRECMDSVVGQSLKEIEILCIDAGSTDGTLEILREYETADPRVKVIVSDKKSYGYQMNLGLDAATGEYIGIVETDDWAEPDMFEGLCKAASEQDADVVKANYYWYYTKPEQQNKPFENLAKCPYEEVFSPREIHAFFQATPAIWSGIYRREMLTAAQIRFNETPGASYQDTSFYFMICTAAERVYLLNRYFMHYRRDNESSSVNSAGKIYCLCDEMEHYERFLEGRPADSTALYPFYMALKSEKYRWNYARLAPQFQWEFLERVREEFLAHRQAGYLEKSSFTDTAWKDLNEILDDPVGYFRRTCKAYATRPMGERLPAAELLRQCSCEAPDLTIIIPVYNNEAYVARSIESARNQTLKNLEILCINDGSSDESLRVILEQADADVRITVLSQCNQGQASARNAALAIAKGRYVQFLDGDDTLREDAAASLIAQADEEQLDILYFDGCSEYSSPELEKQFPFYLDAYAYDWEPEQVISGADFYCRAIQDGKFKASVCMAIYRRTYLEQIGLRFIDGILHEDNPFSQTAALKAERVRHTKEQYYRRLVHENSTMTRVRCFQHLYGYLMSLQNALELAWSLPYKEEVNKAISKAICGYLGHIRNIYAEISDAEACWKRLTPVEQKLLDMAGKQNGGGPWGNSRLGNALWVLFWPLRKILGGIRCIKDHGLSYTLRYMLGGR